MISNIKKVIGAVILGALVHSVGAEVVFRRGNGAEPHSIDPQIAEGVPEHRIISDLFEGLLVPDAEGKPVPGLAKSWDISEDKKTYTFHLREAKWSDGTPITADDVVFGMQRLVDPATGSTYSFVLYPIENAREITEGTIKDVSQLGVKVLDAKTVQIKLIAPTVYFLGLMAFPSAYPVPKVVIEKYGKNWTRPEHIVTSGAFKVGKWMTNAQLVLEKSDTYWDKDSVKLDKVIYYPIEDTNSELKRYRAGELDWTETIPIDQLQWIKNNLADEFHIAPYLGVYYYGLNQAKPPFKDNPKLRRALTLAIDRDVLTEKVTAAGEIPAYGFVPPGVANYPESYKPAYANWDMDKRIEEAKKLYAEAGYGPENPLKLQLLYNTNESHKKIAIAIAAMWKKALGVEAELINQEWKVFLQSRREKNTMIFRAGWISDYNDPSTFLDLFQSDSGLNDVGFSNKEFDSLVAQAEKEPDVIKRAQLLEEAEKILVDDDAVIPIYYYVTKRLIKPHVKGYKLNVLDRTLSKYISIEK